MPRRVIDQALCDRARLLAGSHPLGTVAELLGLRPSQISVIRKRGWRAATHEALRRPRPSDLAIQQAHMTFDALCRHYACGNTTMQRWLADLPGRRPDWRGRNRRRPYPTDTPAAATAGVSSPLCAHPRAGHQEPTSHA